MPYGRSRLTAASQLGDPFLGGLIKGIGRAAGGIVGGFLKGGPLGALTGGIGSIIGVPPRGLPAQIRPPPITVTAPLPFGGRVGTTFFGGGAPAVAGAAAMVGGADGCPKGHRLNKSGYFLQTGQFVAPFSKCVRIRRTNPGNTRALRRSLRRVESFAGLVSRTRKATRRVKKI